MARARSPIKRTAIIRAAVQEIAQSGLSASTANIAKRAGIAAGTLFTYFATKEELLNELYFELKCEVYARVNADFPHKASLERRAKHVWSSFLAWAIEFPAKRKVTIQLTVSGLVTPATLARTAAMRGSVDQTLNELGERDALRNLPAGFAAACLSSMQEATMDFVAKQPKKRAEIIEAAFQVFWRAVR